ncbi:phage tail tape measure protein [Acidaminobacter hydrogenoformans]|uniref:Phage tail tape measure protein, TP901 family, core region n=1 Tax=Acidaminobacter hydrogenoformans DSM 2784 TaxID=1120920 RepID=A0A1G5S2J2_9FIRM|nr:phage tail tape measure protein [Acidaminobacter hydrogenoformans]SCZ80388.1 phage tail tape measure protein, TP901 family, core region [Acidaminobacter hydrogenoformans DSM 2784]
MAVIRSLTVKIGADLTKLQTGLNDAKKHISKFGRDMTSAGQTLTKSVTAPIAGMTVVLGKIGNDFDKAFDKIRVGTGATGDALLDLQDSFKTVMKQVPNSMDEVSTAIADLNTRTGLSGEALEDLAVQFLNLAKITGEDLTTAIGSGTRVFGDWSIAAEDSGASMDYLFKVSQSTGIGFSTLSDNLVKFGAPLRQMGFDFETSAALMGKFEKEGVNTELVLGGLRVALGKMSREGITDTKAALTEVTQRIKEAGSTGEANAIALDLFGAKVGPDMAAAIREGRFEIEGLVSTLTSSTETINKATEDTRSFSENMAIMKNNLLTALEPLGTQLVTALDAAMPAIAGLIDKITGLVQWFTNLDPSIQTTIVSVLAAAAAIGPLLIIIGKISTGIASLIPLISMMLSPIGLVVLAIGGLIAIFVNLYKTNETFRDIVLGIWEKIREVGEIVFTAVGEVVKITFEAISAIIDVFVGWATKIWEEYGERITAIANLFSEALQTVFDFISGFIKTTFEVIGAIIEAFVTLATGIWQKFGDTTTGITSTLSNTIKGIFDGALKIIRGVLEVFIGLFTGDWSRMKDGLTSIWSGLWIMIKVVLLGAWNTLVGAFNLLKNNISGFFTGLAKSAISWGSDIVSGIIDGFQKKTKALKDAARKLANAIGDKVKSFFKIGSPSKLMVEYGENISKGLQLGIEKIKVDPVIHFGNLPGAGDLDRRLPSPTDLAKNPLTIGAAGGISVNFYAPVYGLLDFEKQVKQIVKEAAVNGAFRGVL